MEKLKEYLEGIITDYAKEDGKVLTKSDLDERVAYALEQYNEIFSFHRTLESN